MTETSARAPPIGLLADRARRGILIDERFRRAAKAPSNPHTWLRGSAAAMRFARQLDLPAAMAALRRRSCP